MNALNKNTSTNTLHWCLKSCCCSGARGSGEIRNAAGGNKIVKSVDRNIRKFEEDLHPLDG